MPLTTRGESARRRWRFGIVPKILALVLVPMLVLAAFNAYTLVSSTDRLDTVLEDAAQRERVSIALNDSVARVKDDVIGLQQVLAELIAVHQRSLLRGEPDLASPTRAHREDLARRLKAFTANVTALAERVERAGLLKDANVGADIRAEAGRRLGYLERSRTMLARLLSLFERANARTLQALEDRNIERAANNFIFEERERLKAMRRRLARNADMAVTLGEQLRTIEGQRTRIARGTARDEAASITTFHAAILAAAILLVMAAAAAVAAYGFARPLKRMVTVMLAYAEERTDRPIPPARDDEIGDMGKALAVFRERTEEAKQMRAALHSAKDKAEEANRAKTRFLSTMSHELRTPLNAVIGFADVIRNRVFGEVSDAYAKYADNIYHSGRHLLELVNDLLDLSRLESGRYDFSPAWIDLTTVAKTCSDMLHPRASERGVHLTHDLPHGLPVRADERAVRQVLLNILTNAVKFTDAGGTVHLHGHRLADGRARLMVRDTGAGISQADIERVLQPMHQSDARISRDQDEGSGLGLAISRDLIELHGGTLHLDSSPGRGTTVTIELPRDSVAAAGAEAESRPAAE